VLEDVQVAHDIMALIRGTEGPPLREAAPARAFAPVAWTPPPSMQAHAPAAPLPPLLSTLPQHPSMPAQGQAPRRVIRVGQF
jgi:hypothetical protein